MNGCAAQQSDIHQLNYTNKDLVDISIRNSDRLTTLVSDILDMARIASGRFALESKPVNAMQTLIDTLELNTPYCKKCNVQTKISTTTGKDLSIHADEKRIQQVLGNLISNASKFTHQGDTLELLLSEDSAHHQAVFSITDHGPGIPAEEIPNLFNRFHQIAENNNNKVAGTGLGLNICKQIVELHGGGLWVESEPNVKTTFSFSIPLADGTLLSFSSD